MTEYCEIEEAKQFSNIKDVNSSDQTNFKANRSIRFNIGAREINQARGRGGPFFVRQTGENNPYDMTFSPMHIYEYQVLPIGIHYLPKSFRPNLTTI